MEVARHFCEEVDFLLYGKKYTVIGFRNEADGYELRSEHFRGSSSPKDVTFINNHTKHVSVFEGFFNFLSFFAGTDRATLPSNNIDDLINKAVDNVSRMDCLYENGTVTETRLIVSSIYPEKLIFDGFNYRTPRISECC